MMPVMGTLAHVRSYSFSSSSLSLLVSCMFIPSFFLSSSMCSSIASPKRKKNKGGGEGERIGSTYSMPCSNSTPPSEPPWEKTQ